MSDYIHEVREKRKRGQDIFRGVTIDRILDQVDAETAAQKAALLERDAIWLPSKDAEIETLRLQLEQSKPGRDAAEVIDRLRAQLREAEATIKNKDIVLDAYREETADLRDDAIRLAKALGETVRVLEILGSFIPADIREALALHAAHDAGKDAHD